MIWKPHVTVSAVAERDGRFLVVEEEASGRLVLNNPAGHLEDNETLIEAVMRETLEETAWEFQPEAITGIYLWRHPHRERTFLRVNFCGRCIRHHAGRSLDDGIRRTLWLSREELESRRTDLRSPLVLRCIDDHLAGARHPLTILTHLNIGENGDNNED